MKADLSKPHIYVNGKPVNTEVAKHGHELLQTLKHVSAVIEHGGNVAELKNDIKTIIRKTEQ